MQRSHCGCVAVAWRIGGQSRQRDGEESERGQRGQDGCDGDGGREDRAGDPSAGEPDARGDAQEPGLGGDVEQRSAREEEPDGG
jgi:hypothetical protein